MSLYKNRCSGWAIDFWERKACRLAGMDSAVGNCLLGWGTQKDWNIDGDDDDKGDHIEDGDNYDGMILEAAPLLLLVQLTIGGIILHSVLQTWMKTPLLTIYKQAYIYFNRVYFHMLLRAFKSYLTGLCEGKNKMKALVAIWPEVIF